MTVAKGRIGSPFDSFLLEEGLYQDVTAAAIKRVLTRQLTDAMKAGDITKSEMARRMQTSRSQLDRLRDPDKTRIRLETPSGPPPRKMSLGSLVVFTLDLVSAFAGPAPREPFVLAVATRPISVLFVHPGNLRTWPGAVKRTSAPGKDTTAS